MMHASNFSAIQWASASAAGGLLGAGFGVMQGTARRRYEQLQQNGQLRSEWLVVRGSSRRIIALLLALGMLQVLCPWLFTSGGQWWLSGGVLAGYAVALTCQYRRRAAQVR